MEFFEVPSNFKYHNNPTLSKVKALRKKESQPACNYPQIKRHSGAGTTVCRTESIDNFHLEWVILTENFGYARVKCFPKL